MQTHISLDYAGWAHSCRFAQAGHVRIALSLIITIVIVQISACRNGGRYALSARRCSTACIRWPSCIPLTAAVQMLVMLSVRCIAAVVCIAQRQWTTFE